LRAESYTEELQRFILTHSILIINKQEIYQYILSKIIAVNSRKYIKILKLYNEIKGGIIDGMAKPP
jgi:hypothetical protein